MPSISCSVTLAEPISMYLYICIESAEIISPFNSLASFIESSVLPTAVGPPSTNSFCFISLFPLQTKINSI